MFKRRKPLTILQKTKEMIWPSMGWRRALSYFKNRIIRLSDTPHNIALGLAIGAGVSFSPIMGTHLIQAGVLTYIVRGNIVAALVGTLIGNPWTFPFIWWASLSLGSVLFDVFGFPTSTHLPESGVTISMFWDMLWHEPERILFPWLLGGYILCIIIIVGFYPVYFYLIQAAQVARAKMHVKAVQKRAHKEADTITKPSR